jgi:hypothetical protein
VTRSRRSCLPSNPWPGLSSTPGGRQARSSKCAWTWMQRKHKALLQLARTEARCGAGAGHVWERDEAGERDGPWPDGMGCGSAQPWRESWSGSSRRAGGLDDRVRARTSVRPLAWPAAGGPRVVTSARRSRTWPCLLPINCRRSSQPACDGRGTSLSLTQHAQRAASC